MFRCSSVLHFEYSFVRIKDLYLSMSRRLSLLSCHQSLAKYQFVWNPVFRLCSAPSGYVSIQLPPHTLQCYNGNVLVNPVTRQSVLVSLLLLQNLISGPSTTYEGGLFGLQVQVLGRHFWRVIETRA